MILVSYDISDNKLRTQLAEFLLSHGIRLQYSLYQIENNQRVLDIITYEINNNFSKRFSNADSILLIKTKSESEQIIRYGYAQQREQNLLIL